MDGWMVDVIFFQWNERNGTGLNSLLGVCVRVGWLLACFLFFVWLLLGG